MRTRSTFALSTFWLAALTMASLPLLWSSSANADSCRKKAPRHHMVHPTSSSVFVSTRDGVAKIYLGNADGSSARRLTRMSGEERNPCLSPNGRTIVFQSNRDGNWEIYRINRDGSNLRRFTRDSGPYAPSDTEPVFSPDGGTIAWTSTRVNGDYSDIWLMNSTGDNQRRLTSSDDEHSISCPTFAPKGMQIAYLERSTQTSVPLWTLNMHDLHTGATTTTPVIAQIQIGRDKTTASSTYHLRYNPQGTRLSYVEKAPAPSGVPLWFYDLKSNTPAPGLEPTSST